MNILSERINYLAESETLAMSRISGELKRQGIDVINLSIGEPDFNTPDFIKESAKKALDDNWTHYTPVSGYYDLREAVCAKFKRDNNLDYKPEEIVVSTGAKQAIANVVLSLINPGDEILVPVPYWVSYREIVKLASGKPVYIPTTIETDFKITPQALEAAITPKTKLFIFSSPCNPSGSVYTQQELNALAKVFEKYNNIYIISDEIYEFINFEGKHSSIALNQSIKDRVIIINGLSKGFAMTGWRLGYMAANKIIADACNKMQGQFTSGTNSICQRAAITALLAEPEKCTTEMVKAFRERRDLLLELLKDIPGFKCNLPTGAFYIFPDVSYYYGKSDGETKINNGEELCKYLLYKANVALVAGSAFGDDRCIRFSYATSKEQLIKAASRIKNTLAKLK
ncbi:MAG: pyridoxal phosphate-dependent aminotransferase [Bacteroidales bacterium]|nr:pyridoxal phosphate-dependent aminotransferase [Bacteroidales bacterium]